MIQSSQISVELTPAVERLLAGTTDRYGIALVPSSREFGSVRVDRFCWSVGLTGDSPADVAAVLSQFGAMALLVESEARAAEIRPHTRLPVVSRLEDLVNVNGIHMVDRLNLAYHVYAPLHDDTWRANLDQLLDRWALFNGRKVVAIVTSENIHPPEVVQRYIDRPDAEYIVRPNHVRLRSEAATFLPLMDIVQSTDPAEATFFAHTKGCSSVQQPAAVAAWRNAMYAALLDQPQVVREMLRAFAMVGTCKIVWPRSTKSPYPSGLDVGNWMLAGTFFWIRHAAVFSRDWRRLADDRYAVEAWPSTILDEQEAVSLYQPWPVDQFPIPSPYTLATHGRNNSRCIAGSEFLPLQPEAICGQD